jgi:RHS repeat-associated protein
MNAIAESSFYSIAWMRLTLLTSTCVMCMAFLSIQNVKASNSYGFAAENADSDTGLVYNRERVYDPSTGSFLSKDALGVQGGLNNYQYSGNNPINDVDPLGTSPTDIITGYSYGVTNGLISSVNGIALISSGSAGQLLNSVGLFPRIPKLTPVGAINQDFLNGENGGSFFFNVGSLTLGAGSAAVGITRLSTAAPAVLNSGVLPLSQIVTGVSDDALVHFSATPLSTVEPVNGAVWSFQYGDISGLTPTQVEGTIGNLASSGQQGAAQVMNVLDASAEGADFVYLTNQPAGMQPAEYVFDNAVPVLQSIPVQGAGVSSISLGTDGAASTVSLGDAFGGLAVTGPLAVGGVLINEAATLVGTNLSNIVGATYDPTTNQIVFLGSNNTPTSTLSSINMDYFYTAIQAVYGSATPPYVTLDPPASPATQWPYSQTFTNNSTQGFVMLYNPLWAGQDTTVGIIFRLTDQAGNLYNFTYNFNCVELNGTNGYPSISAGGRYAMGLVYSGVTGTPPANLTLNTEPFQSGLPESMVLNSTSQTSYWPVQLTNLTGGNLVVSSVTVVPARQHREYGGRVDGTKLGWVMFEADRVMKCLAVGTDNLTGASYNSTTIGSGTGGNNSIPGYKNLEELAQSLGDTGGYNRLWFEPDDMTLQQYINPTSGQATIGFQSSTVELLTQAYLQGLPPDPAAQAFATFFTSNYPTFATQSFPVEDPVNPSQIDNVPIFAMLQQAMQAVCLARFFHDNNIPLDQWWMSSYQPPVANTPLTVATAFNEASPTGSPWYLIAGGVQIFKPNTYVPSSNAQSLGSSVLSARPASTSSSAQDVPGQVWNVNGTTQGNVTAVSASLAQNSQAGNVNLDENDLTFASPGELPLQFTRYYQSSWIGTTNLGPGWRDVRYTLQFSNLSWYDQYHLLTDGSGHTLTTATSGDTYLHSGTVRLVDLSSGSNLNFSSSLSLTYSVNAQGNPVSTITGLNANDLPTFTPGTNQSGATLTQNNDGTFDYTATLPDGSSLLLDPNGNLLQTTDRHGHKQIYAYSSGQLNTVTDDAGQVLQLNYTSGLLSSVTGPDGEGTSYHYNNSGLLTSVVNTLSNVQIAQYSYNSSTNQLATVTRMDGTTPITTTPDVKGRSSSRLDVNGNSTNYTYVKNSDGSRTTSASLVNSGLSTAQVNSDTMGRSTSVTDMLGHTTGYSYTGNSLLPNSIQLPTSNRPAIQIARNSNGQPTMINDPAVVGAYPTQVSYYPSNNLPEQVLDGAQRPTNFYYTATNNLQTLRRQHNGANVDINYGYDSQDNLNSIKDPLGHTWQIGHDSLGRITSATDPTGVQASCTYDQYGNVSTATIPGATIPGQNYSIKYSYDALHRLTGITTPTGSTTYQYDPVTQWVDTATQKDTSGNTLETVSYNYNNSTGQVTGVTNTLTQPGGSTSTPVTTTYGYNSYGNVSSVTPSSGQPLNFNYNAAGQLLGTSETDSGPAVGPTILASNASSGVWTNQNSQTMSWGAPESSLPITGYSYAEDGSAGTTVNVSGASLVWSNISNGQHTFTMRAVDSAGNWSPQSIFNLWINNTSSLLPIPTGQPSYYPNWWFTRGVILRTNSTVTNPVWPTNYPPADDYAVVNQGQLKNIASQAYAELCSALPSSAWSTTQGVALTNMIQSWTPTAGDAYAVINLGQLKNVAKPFYDLLIQQGMASQYPWTGAANPADDYAAANIGQVKNIFNSNIP